MTLRQGINARKPAKVYDQSVADMVAVLKKKMIQEKDPVKKRYLAVAGLNLLSTLWRQMI